MKISGVIISPATFLGVLMTLSACDHFQSGSDKEDSSKAFLSAFDEAKADLASTGKNPYFSLEPGYTLTLEDSKKKDQLIITVLNETKQIDGVETRIIEERETKDGELEEVSRNYFAISKKTGNVYYFGEETTKYKDGKPEKGDDSWESGVNGAHFGMIMPGNPQVGMKYYQEQAPKVAMDRAEIVSLSEKIEVPAGKFENCLKTKETTPLEDDEKEFKFYAAGVGLLIEGDLKLVSHGVRPAR